MEKIQIFKITVLRQLWCLLPVIITTSVLVFIYFIIVGFEFNSIVVFVAGGFILLFSILPTLALHVNYIKANLYSVLKVEVNTKSATYYSRSANVNFSFDEIESIQIVLPYAGNTSWYTFGGYRYCKLVFKSGRHIILTHLMMWSMEKKVEKLFNIKPEEKLMILPFV